HRYVDETVAHAGADSELAGVHGRVQTKRQSVLRGRPRVEIRRDEREAHGLAAVIANPERAQHVEGRAVVAQVRSAETRRRDAAALEELDRARDRRSLAVLIERGVVAVHESVQRELDPPLRIAPQKIGMSLE